MEIAPASFTVLVSSDPGSLLPVIDRLGGMDPDSGALWGGQRLDTLPTDEVRRRILVADNDAHLFAGTLRSVVLAGATAADAAVLRAITVASADDDRSAFPVADAKAVRSAVTALIRRERPSFAVVVLTDCLAAIAGVASPWLLGRMIDDVQSAGSVHAVNLLSLAVVGFAILYLVAARFAQHFRTRLGEQIQAHLREQYLDRIL